MAKLSSASAIWPVVWSRVLKARLYASRARSFLIRLAMLSTKWAMSLAMSRARNGSVSSTATLMDPNRVKLALTLLPYVNAMSAWAPGSEGSML